MSRYEYPRTALAAEPVGPVKKLARTRGVDVDVDVDVE